MKRLKKILALSVTLIALNSFSQVGIGIANPDTLSILDLSNGNGKGLKLPYLLATPSSGAGAKGMLMYYKQDLYFRDTVGYNIVNPWKYKYNGSTTEAVYFNPTGYVGAGIGVSDANIKGNLHVSLNGKDVLATSTSAALFIGESDTTTHMIFDNDEIMVKTSPNTVGTLKLQEGGGTVQVGQRIRKPSTFNVFGKVQENGKDLLPRGMIIMWSGAKADIPGGWALCDGKYYNPNDTTDGQTGVAAADTAHTVKTPNLTDKFVVGAGSSYSPGDTGGANTVKLLTTHLPSHSHTIDHGHTVTDPGHKHDIKMNIRGNENGSDQWTLAWQGVTGGYTETAYTGLTVDSHSGSSGNTGGNTAHENRPPYYALTYIMKL